VPRSIFHPEFRRKLEILDLVSRKRMRGRGKGERRGPKRGSGVEFHDFRPYAAGDDLRYLDWNIFSRLDRLILKLFIEEEDLCLHLLLDCSRSMAFGEPSKLLYAARAAAALAFVALSGHERAALGILGEGLAALSRPLRGRSQIFTVLKQLEGLTPQGGTNLNLALTAYARQARSPGLAILFTDLLDGSGFETGLASLLGRGYEAVLIHLVTPGELDPAVTGDLLLTDAETGERREVVLTLETRRRYLENLRALCGRAEDFCRRSGADYLRISTALPFEDFILTHLTHGGVLA
jgi:uncharacterized protein (DUF58 family)